MNEKEKKTKNILLRNKKDLKMKYKIMGEIEICVKKSFFLFSKRDLLLLCSYLPFRSGTIEKDVVVQTMYAIRGESGIDLNVGGIVKNVASI